MQLQVTAEDARLGEAEVANFLQDSLGPEKSPFNWLFAAPTAVTARVGDELAGVGVVRSGDLHPVRSWAAVAVAPAFRRKGVGTALHHALVEFSSKPLKTKLQPAAAPARAFAVALGLEVLVRSHVVLVDPGRHLASLRERCAEVDIKAADPTAPNFRRAVAGLYRRIHAWDPPAKDADVAVANDFCTDNVAFAVTARQHREIIGVGLAHHSDRGPHLEAAMIGTVAPDEPGAPITAALLAAVLESGAPVEVEVDEGEGAHDELLSTVRHVSPLPPDPLLIVATA